MSDLREADKWLENNPICDADDLNKRERELVNAAWQAALQSQTAPAVPEEWKLVPIEPTSEMRRKAGLHRGADYYTIRKVWREMLAAAPQPAHSGDANRKGAIPFAPIQCGQPDSPYRDNENMKDHIADAGKVAFVDGVGAQRMLAEECKEGIGHIIHGDNIYWPLSDDDELRFIQAACGNGEFTYPGAAPSVPENEIKAQGITWAAEYIREQNSSLIVEDLADDLDIEAARLRTAGDEGEGSQ